MIPSPATKIDRQDNFEAPLRHETRDPALQARMCGFVCKNFRGHVVRLPNKPSVYCLQYNTICTCGQGEGYPRLGHSVRNLPPRFTFGQKCPRPCRSVLKIVCSHANCPVVRDHSSTGCSNTLKNLFHQNQLASWYCSYALPNCIFKRASSRRLHQSTLPTPIRPIPRLTGAP